MTIDLFSMGRFLFFFTFIYFSNISVNATCFVDYSNETQFYLKGSSVRYIIVQPSDQTFKSAIKFKIKNQSILIQKVITNRNRHSELSTGDIVKAIRESLHPVIILAEGKASADVLESFLQYPELEKKVKCFYSINGFIRGAEYAEKANKPIDVFQLERAAKLPLISALGFVAQFIVQMLKPQDPIQYSFHPQVRTQYLKNHEREILKISKKIQLFTIDQGHKEYGHLPYSKIIHE